METEKLGGTGRYEISVMDETITVEPGTWNAYRASIDVTMQMSDCYVIGSFSASGGYGNDIEFLVFEEKDYKEWEYRMDREHPGEPGDVPALYRSGRVIADTLYIPVAHSDTYYLVFNNHFSNFSHKEVQVKISLSYGQ